MKHLRVAATGGTTLDTKGGALRGLAQAGKHVLVQVRTQGLHQAAYGRALALAKRRRGDAAYDHVLAAGALQALGRNDHLSEDKKKKRQKVSKEILGPRLSVNAVEQLVPAAFVLFRPFPYLGLELAVRVILLGRQSNFLGQLRDALGLLRQRNVKVTCANRKRRRKRRR